MRYSERDVLQALYSIKRIAEGTLGLVAKVEAVRAVIVKHGTHGDPRLCEIWELAHPTVKELKDYGRMLETVQLINALATRHILGNRKRGLW